MLGKATALVLCIAGSAMGQITSLDLSQYQHVGTFQLPAAASEASAITFNRDNGNLFIVGDEGKAIVEVTRSGSVVSTMSLSGFDDTEGLTYMGAGRFAIVEERIQSVYMLDYVAGGSANRANLQGVALGPNVGNVGLEGASFDPLTGRFILVKEKTPQAVLDADINFAAGTANVNNLFNPAGLGVLDLSDVQVLSTVPSLIGTPDQDNLLIYSQESALLMEVTRSGTVLSTFDFSGLSSIAEGVTIDSDGYIYICDESPQVFVLAPIPAPGAAAILLAGMAAAGLRRRRTASAC